MRRLFLIFVMFLLLLPIFSGAADYSKLSIEEKLAMVDRQPTDKITLNRYRTLIDMLQEKDGHNRDQVWAWVSGAVEELKEKGIKETHLSVMEHVNRLMEIKHKTDIVKVLGLYVVMRGHGYNPDEAVNYGVSHTGW